MVASIFQHRSRAGGGADELTAVGQRATGQANYPVWRLARTMAATPNVITKRMVVPGIDHACSKLSCLGFQHLRAYSATTQERLATLSRMASCRAVRSHRAALRAMARTKGSTLLRRARIDVGQKLRHAAQLELLRPDNTAAWRSSAPHPPFPFLLAKTLRSQVTLSSFKREGLGASQNLRQSGSTLRTADWLLSAIAAMIGRRYRLSSPLGPVRAKGLS